MCLPRDVARIGSQWLQVVSRTATGSCGGPSAVCSLWILPRARAAEARSPGCAGRDSRCASTRYGADAGARVNALRCAPVKPKAPCPGGASMRHHARPCADPSHREFGGRRARRSRDASTAGAEERTSVSGRSGRLAATCRCYGLGRPAVALQALRVLQRAGRWCRSACQRRHRVALSAVRTSAPWHRARLARLRGKRACTHAHTLAHTLAHTQANALSRAPGGTKGWRGFHAGGEGRRPKSPGADCVAQSLARVCEPFQNTFIHVLTTRPTVVRWPWSTYRFGQRVVDATYFIWLA